MSEPTPTAPTPEPTPPTPPAPAPSGDPQPLHEDPAIAKALEGLTDAQRETLLTQGGKNALAARAAEVKAAKEAAAKAAEQARSDLAQTVGKALGIVQDDPIDPAKLTEELTAERFAAQQARVELAIFKAAGAANGDPAALLDSSSFLRSLDGIDPSDSTAITAAISAAVAANPRLGVAPAAPGMPQPNPGQGQGGAPLSDEALTDAEYALFYPNSNRK